jgi:hypothetical protein
MAIGETLPNNGIGIRQNWRESFSGHPEQPVEIDRFDNLADR